MAAAAALAIDVPLARWALEWRVTGDMGKLLRVIESFGHGGGVAIVVLAVCALAPCHRVRAVRLLASAFGGGLLANVLKMTVGRTRPWDYDVFTGGVWGTFQGWFPLFGTGSWQESFPSAHAATAMGLAMAMGRFYPRAWWLFYSLAFLVGVERMQGRAHFLSDVLVGAALGWVAAKICVDLKAVARGFDRFAARLTAPSPPAPLPQAGGGGR